MVMFVFSPFFGIELWWISFVFAIGLFIYDSAMDLIEREDKDMIFYRTFRRYVYRRDTKVYDFRLHMIYEHMPWKIIPFLVSLFIMVEGLLVTGFVDMAASFIAWLSPA